MAPDLISSAAIRLTWQSNPLARLDPHSCAHTHTHTHTHTLQLSIYYSMHFTDTFLLKAKDKLFSSSINEKHHWISLWCQTGAGCIEVYGEKHTKTQHVFTEHTSERRWHVHQRSQDVDMLRFSRRLQQPGPKVRFSDVMTLFMFLWSVLCWCCERQECRNRTSGLIRLIVTLMVYIRSRNRFLHHLSELWLFFVLPASQDSFFSSPHLTRQRPALWVWVRPGPPT